MTEGRAGEEEVLAEVEDVGTRGELLEDTDTDADPEADERGLPPPTGELLEEREADVETEGAEAREAEAETEKETEAEGLGVGEREGAVGAVLQVAEVPKRSQGQELFPG